MAKKTPPSKANKKPPMLQIAVFCERILEENDGVMSIMRIVDRVIISTDKDEMQPGMVELGIVVAVKSGDAIGKRKVKLVGVDPKGESIFQILSEFDLKGAGHGTRIAKQIPIPVASPGMHWCDVYIDNQLHTKMPLDIVYRKRVPEPLESEAGTPKKTQSKKSSTKRK